jgi:hypothetical protein
VAKEIVRLDFVYLSPAESFQLNAESLILREAAADGTAMRHLVRHAATA